jgi:hemolysin-activating ACP:hemolysin acyltransferase
MFKGDDWSGTTENAGATPPGAAGGPAGAGGASGSIFTGPVPGGTQKTMANMLGEVVWLMSQSPAHKQFFISDLEWFVMTPLLLQFRVFYAKDRPMGVVLWASVSDEVAERLASGTTKLRPQDWKSGDKLWVIEVIAPFGGAEYGQGPEGQSLPIEARALPRRQQRRQAGEGVVMDEVIIDNPRQAETFAKLDHAEGKADMPFVWDRTRLLALDRERGVTIKVVNTGGLLNLKQVFEFRSADAHFYFYAKSMNQRVARINHSDET